MWALDLGVSMVCVFESPLKGIPSLGFQPPICHLPPIKHFLGSFSGVLPTVPGTALTVPPRTGHFTTSNRVLSACGLGVMRHVPGRCGTHTFRKWVFRMVVGGINQGKPACANCFPLDPFLYFASVCLTLYTSTLSPQPPLPPSAPNL
jgi:hypothetical protein